MNLHESIDQIQSDFQQKLSDAKTSSDIENIKVLFLGKKGPVQALMPKLKDCSKEERPKLGQLINQLKQQLSKKCEEALETLASQELGRQLEQEWIDVTLPGHRQYIGKEHPITQMLKRVIDALSGMGFSVQYGPDVDTNFYNFESLNFPEDHPALDMQDTFYLSTDYLLRTHTSNVQVRVMETHQPPIRVIAPGRCFRNETISARSHVFFHQVEGFYIDKQVSFSDLFSVMDEFWSKLLGRKMETRFRPSYFPFVEPGMEVDVSCTACNGAGCALCKQTGWLEVAGAGMIHPNVLRSGGIDPEEYSGYAFGLGVERLALLLYDIPDIRMFTENDMRFLSQFS